jgi:hypothetical protein
LAVTFVNVNGPLDFSPLSSVYIGEVGTIMLATMTSNSDTLVLALAALGEATKI